MASTVSRLVIDLNRSIGHPQLFSVATRGAPAETRAQIVEQCYRPHREQVEAPCRASGFARRARDPHFVAQLHPGTDGRVRGADVGLLYDPGRPGEAQLLPAGRNRSRR